MKKTMKILLIVLSLMLAMSVVSFAADEGTITVGSASGKAGDTVEIEIEVDDNPGIAMARFMVSYDADALEIKDVEDGGIWGKQVHSNDLESNPYTLFWSNPTTTENIVENGTLVTIEFKIKSGTKAGNYPIAISYSNKDIIDKDMGKVAFDVEDGEITVKSSGGSSGGGSSSGGSSSGGSSGGSSSGSNSGSSDKNEEDVNTDDKKEEVVEPVEPEVTVSFADVKDADWFKASVDYVVSNGLMNGVSENSFAPNSNLTRAMLVTVLYRAEGEPATNRSIPFADVDLGSYYSDAVIWAKQNNIVNGVDETNFAPNKNITREQVATIMYRYAIYKGMDAVDLSENLGFVDANEISEYAVPALNWAVGQKLINGYENNTVKPGNSITRAEMATILKRFLEK